MSSLSERLAALGRTQAPTATTSGGTGSTPKRRADVPTDAPSSSDEGHAKPHTPAPAPAAAPASGTVSAPVSGPVSGPTAGADRHPGSSHSGSS
ncbi:MAG: hypothetical protein JWR64_2500, partial [Marmoricola sp.]|nr:hypothetical protein [Marmoricola sp.]